MSEQVEQITVSVLFFARAAELAQRKSQELVVRSGSRLADVIARVEAEFPALTDLIQYSRWAIGNDFADTETILESDTTIALIPPVSGG